MAQTLIFLDRSRSLADTRVNGGQLRTLRVVADPRAVVSPHATTGLPSSYVHVFGRLESFSGIDRETRDRVRAWLLTWKGQVERFGTPLPAPWVFCNPEGVVELEWHNDTRHVILTLCDGMFEYAAQLATPKGERDIEGPIDIESVHRLLRWFVG